MRQLRTANIRRAWAALCVLAMLSLVWAVPLHQGHALQRSLVPAGGEFSLVICTADGLAHIALAGNEAAGDLDRDPAPLPPCPTCAPGFAAVLLPPLAPALPVRHAASVPVAPPAAVAHPARPDGSARARAPPLSV